MGSIYRVVDERTGRKLALKRLRANKTSAYAVISAQFEREYHTLSQLAHPRIIEVYVSAILVLHADRIKRDPAERELFSRVAAALLEQDVGGVVLEESVTATSD